jgi:nucleoside phosphorylase
MELLPRESILSLHTATVQLRLPRDVLLSGLDPAFVGSLPQLPTLTSQILSDLGQMNGIARLSNGSVPLGTWLRNAVHLAGPRREAEIFRQALAVLDATTVPEQPEEPVMAKAARVVEVVCLTALPLEMEAVRRHLEAPREEVLDTGTIIEIGSFAAASRRIQVGVVEVGQGNAATAAIAQEVLLHFKPKAILFVGVAGGTKDVKIGDVVAATKVYGYESGKAAEIFLPRPDVGQSSYRLVQRARAEARGTAWLERLERDRSREDQRDALRTRPGSWSPSPPPVPAFASAPRAHVGPIAAGAAVVASTQAPLYAFLRAQYGDALAVEMEGRGFLEAAYHNPHSDALVVRGISDLIDKKGESDASGSQPLAARNAAAFAFEVVAKVF